MTQVDSWQVSVEAAEVYETCFVPAIFRAWAEPLADAAAIGAGDRVLDVGCGTGIVSREALRRVAPDGSVVGLDLNEGMLTVAAQLEPGVDWKKGDASALPFDDASFDAVVSQFALMFFPDRAAALSEMWRTLAPGGRLAVSVWGPLERARGYAILVDLINRSCGTNAAEVMRAPFSLGDEAALARLAADTGIPQADIRLAEGWARFPSVSDLVHTEIKGSPLAESLSAQAMDALAAELENALAEFVVPSGELVMPMDAYIVTAEKS